MAGRHGPSPEWTPITPEDELEERLEIRTKQHEATVPPTALPTLSEEKAADLPPPPGCHDNPAARGSAPNALRPLFLLNTGPILVDGVAKEYLWKNQTGEMLLIARTELWIGAGYGSIIDVQTNLYRAYDRYPIHMHGCDLYANPAARTVDDVHDFGTNWIELASDDGIYIVLSAVRIGGPMKGQSHHRGQVFFRS